MNQLKDFLNKIEILTTSNYSPKKIKKKYCKISEEFYDLYFNDSDLNHLLEPLKDYFLNHDKIFIKKKKPHPDELEEFLDASDMLITFWKDTFDDFDILIKR